MYIVYKQITSCSAGSHLVFLHVIFATLLLRFVCASVAIQPTYHQWAAAASHFKRDIAGLGSGCGCSCADAKADYMPVSMTAAIITQMKPQVQLYVTYPYF